MDYQKEYQEYEVIKKKEISRVKGDFIDIIKSEFVLNNGIILTREEITKNSNNSNAVIILPITKEKEVILVMQPRVLKTGIALELPAGYIDQDETSLEAAKRELQEETGYTSNEFLKLFSYYQDQGCSRVKNDCYLALNCFKTSDLELDHDEHIKLFKETLTKVYELMEEGIINDAGSVITLEKARGKIK